MDDAFELEGLDPKKAHWIDGKPYFTGEAIGEFLGAKWPEEYVKQIVRNHWYIKSFRTTIKLKSNKNGVRTTRRVKVYDPVGVQLIIFQSALPKAVSHRIKAAHLVSAYMNGRRKGSVKPELIETAIQVLCLPKGKERSQIIQELAEREGIHPRTAYRRIERATKSWLRGND